MSSNRRYFLKILASGGAGCILCSSTPIRNVLYSPENLKRDGAIEKENGIFPFFNYLEKYNIGDFIPKDQGGKFIQMELLGTEKDDQITELIKNGLLQKVYGDSIEWSRYEQSEVEKSVWLNRFYFSLSFARMYYLTKDISYIEDMMYPIVKWVNDNPLTNNSHSKSYNWRDMQVAWRSIHWSWCYFLTKEALSPEQKQLFLSILKEHASVLLMWFGEQPLNEFNHQSHGALAMLYLGVLFPDFEEAEKLKATALKILKHHLENAFYNDGGNVEQMFGYYPFEAHIFRDTYLLCSRNNIKIPETLVHMLDKMSKFLSIVSQPNGTMPAINDSYEMNVIPILENFNEILVKDQETISRVSNYFSDTQIAVINTNKYGDSWYVLVYPAKTIGSHAHAGRLAFTLWHNDRPLLIDSGCCNYDNPLLVNWYRTSKAHNTVLIDGKSDEATSSSRMWAGKRATQNRITDWVENDLYTFCHMVSLKNEITNSSVLWNRSLALVKNKFLIIHDYFLSDDEHTYELLFHFPAIQVSEKSKKELRVYKNDPTAIIPANEKKIDSLIISEGLISQNGKNIKAPMATFKFHEKSALHSVMVVVPEIDQYSQIKIEQKNNSNGTAVKIKEANKVMTILLMKNPESEMLTAFGHKTTKPFDVF